MQVVTSKEFDAIQEVIDDNRARFRLLRDAADQDMRDVGQVTHSMALIWEFADQVLGPR